MLISELAFLLVTALMVGPCIARKSGVIFEERFNDCPCSVRLSGQANRPSAIYYELEQVGKQSLHSSRKCSRYPIGPILYNLRVQNFCPKPIRISRRGSYILRVCTAYNHIDAKMDFFEIHRSNRHRCEAEIANDGTHAVRERDCASSCKADCRGVETGEQSPTLGKPPKRQLTSGFVPEKDDLSYVALVQHFEGRNQTLSSTCTGSLIGAKWVLTAGHCENEAGDVAVLGRRWNDANGQIAERGDPHNVANVYRPGKYLVFEDPCDSSIVGVHNQDIALLELEKEVKNAAELAIHVNTDCNYPQDGSCLRVSGHSRTCVRGEKVGFTSTLKTTVVKAIDLSTCNRLLKEAGQTLMVHELRDEKHICALHDGCGSELWSGDSGGPLTMERKKADHKGTLLVQVGVAAYQVDECGQKGRPDVYEPLAEYADWIYRTTGGEAKMYPPFENRHTDCPFTYDGPMVRGEPGRSHSHRCRRKDDEEEFPVRITRCRPDGTGCD